MDLVLRMKIDNADCPFAAAKDSTILKWVGVVFGGVEVLGKLIKDITETGQKLNLEAPNDSVPLKDSAGTCNTIDLIAPELNLVQVLSLKIPTAISKSAQALAANTTKNTSDIISVLGYMIVLSETVRIYHERVNESAKNAAKRTQAVLNASNNLVNLNTDSDSEPDSENEKENGRGHQAKRAKGAKGAKGHII
ncbi:hypothetical protein B484DRAFT_425183 [Ochromonadaceae sp. CCMP2298]|nr:hypothetical protein B484DRAFT_425183 [Ochromonadaceae sp. CCMP2298]